MWNMPCKKIFFFKVQLRIVDLHEADIKTQNITIVFFWLSLISMLKQTFSGEMTKGTTYTSKFSSLFLVHIYKATAQKSYFLIL